MRLTRLLIIFALASVGLLAAEAEHGAGATHGDPLLTAKWINFAVLAAGLGYLFVKFAFPAFRSQQKDILTSIDKAKRQAEKAEAKAREIEARVAGLGQEVEALRAKAADELAAEGRRIEQETAAAIAKIERGAQVEIESAAKAAKQELAAAVARMALDLARQKVAAQMNPSVQASLVEGFTNGLAKSAQ